MYFETFSLGNNSTNRYYVSEKYDFKKMNEVMRYFATEILINKFLSRYYNNLARFKSQTMKSACKHIHFSSFSFLLLLRITLMRFILYLANISFLDF